MEGAAGTPTTAAPASGVHQRRELQRQGVAPYTPTKPPPATTQQQQKWQALPPARVLDAEYQRVAALPAGRVCYLVDPLVARCVARVRPGFDARRGLWRLVMLHAASADVLSVRRGSADAQQLAALGCATENNMLITAHGALAAVAAAAAADEAPNAAAAADATALAEVKTALLELAAADSRLAESLQPQKLQFVLPPAHQQQQQKRDLVQRLVRAMNEMKAQTADLRRLLQNTQQDLAALRAQQHQHQHQQLPTPTGTQTAAVAAATVAAASTDLQQACGAAAAATARLASGAQTTDDDDSVLQSAQGGVTTMLKFLSPKQTILFLSFLEDLVRQYSRSF